MKYKPLVLVAATGLLVLAGATTVEASSNMTTTKGGIEFSKDSGTTAPTPVDPLSPEEEIQTDKTPTGGDYSIVYASDFTFGNHTLTNGDATFFAQNPTVTHLDGTKREVPNFVEIMDRSGSKNGWRLSANLSGPLSSSEGQSIAGVTMSFNNIYVNSTGGFDASAISLPESVTLAGDTKESAMIAQDSEGKTAGFWIVTFGNSVGQGETSVSMFVPNTQAIAAGTYSTSVTWTFEAAL